MGRRAGSVPLARAGARQGHPVRRPAQRTALLARATTSRAGWGYLRYTPSSVTPHGEDSSSGLTTANGRLVRSDALTLAKSLPTGEVDLVYLDPPFGTGASRAMLKGRAKPAGRTGDVGPSQTIRDIAYADPLLDPSSQVELWQEVRRILRPGGAFFLHLDWRTVHASKVLLDGVFGADNFLNEIIWHYATGGVPTRWFSRKHDSILYYVSGPGHTFHRLQEKKYLAHKMSRKGVPEYRDERGWYRYRFLDDVWQIPWLTQDSKERTGYPTQKPVALLTRILEACTEPGDLVADFFCGSGTTAVAAIRLGRRWIAGDESERAIEISRGRIEEEERREREADRDRPTKRPAEANTDEVRSSRSSRTEREDGGGLGDGGNASHE